MTAALTPVYSDYGPYRGHPMDPRTPDESDTTASLRYVIDEAEDLIGRAERALQKGDEAAALDLLHSAGKLMCDADWEPGEGE